MFSTISWNEAALLLSAIVALACNVWLLRITIQDKAVLRRARKNGLRLLVAAGNRRREAYRVAIQVLFFIRAVWSALTPEQAYAPAVKDAAENYKLASLTIILMVQVGLVLSAVLDLRDRRELVAYIHKLDEADSERGHNKREW